VTENEPSPETTEANAEQSARPTAVGHLGIEEYEGHRALVADGVILSVAVAEADPPFGYWAAMLPSERPENALLLGLGAGTLAHLLSRRFHDIPIVGVDNDPELLAFARDHFNLDLPNLEVVVADAFDYVARCNRRFDYVAVDLFVGSEFEQGVLSRRFLRRVKSIGSAEGEIAFNLYRDRRSESHLGRIRRILPITRVDRLRYNVIVHCQLAPPEEFGLRHPP
jgi:spermidine synthase